MTLRIATWNINSVRLRIDLVKQALLALDVDVLCLQETKCPPGHFPFGEFHAAGYQHIAEIGQKSYNGVAIISRLPFSSQSVRSMCAKDDCRHISVTIGDENPVTIHNFYIPAGGDEPDVTLNDKFAHKLQFLDELHTWFAELSRADHQRSIAVGDLNIAPLEHDVWSHKDLLKVVSHTPVETEKLLALQKAGNWVDIMRQHTPEPVKLYSWWSYRAKDWQLNNRGRRLDHIWATPDLAKICSDMKILSETRGWPKPSDHVPVMAQFDISL